MAFSQARAFESSSTLALLDPRTPRPSHSSNQSAACLLLLPAAAAAAAAAANAAAAAAALLESLLA